MLKKVELQEISVYWNYEGRKNAGKITFEQQGSETFISFSDDENGQVIENGAVDTETAEDIKSQIIARNFDMTDFEMF